MIDEEHKFHLKYMQRCLELATCGLGNTAPNPLVGCVIVNNDTIIGEGYHTKYGDRHAEAIAIQSVKDKSLLYNATLYVNLEPCNHQGKTPPCSKLITESKISKIVIGTSDTNPNVIGEGLKYLQQNGCKVISDIMQEACRNINKRFFTFHEQNRPYIILKWAQSADGYIGKKNPGHAPVQISGKQSKLMVQKWRGEEQAIMVGTNTVIFDNPLLTTRLSGGSNPLRIVLDRTQKLPIDAAVFNSEARTLLISEKANRNINGVEIIQLPFDEHLLKAIMLRLFEKKIQSLIVEGGSALLNSFIGNSLWDEARIFISNKPIRSGVKAPEIPPGATSSYIIGEDRLLIINKS